MKPILTLELAQKFEAGDIYEVHMDNVHIANVTSSRHNRLGDGVWSLIVYVLGTCPCNYHIAVADEPITQWPEPIQDVMGQFIDWLESEN